MIEKLTYDDVYLLPQYSEVSSRDTICIRNGSLDLKIPFISANMDSVTESDMAIAMYRAGAFGVVHRLLDSTQLLGILRDVREADARCGITIGVKEDDMELARVAISRGVNVFCIDIAHGHSRHMIESIKRLKNFLNEHCQDNHHIIAGNVCTGKGAMDLVDAGADIIKVGVGPGSHCTTRVVTGHGMPQLSAISEVKRALNGRGAEIIADGGIRNSGDIAKSFAAGADYVMLGKLLAGCDEAPSELVHMEGKLYKSYRGMASTEAQKKQNKKRAAEGVASFIPFTEPVYDTVKRLYEGVQSAFSYTGAHDFKDFRKKAKFIKVTNNSFIEGTPHGV